MTPERWRTLESLFYEASEIDPSGRASFLDRACAGDPALRQEVESLLAAAGKTLREFESPAAEAARAITGGDFVGRTIGPWRITGVVGDGGMGRVYAALRADDAYEQKAALKLMRPDLGADPGLLTRFRFERQILAKLSHPNIARLLDGGVSAEGLPYLVMEYVEGSPINAYCSALPIRERLNLFLKVCDAVEYAHRNLVIHRDIKPANILVTPGGEPKLLDFGIARLLDPEFSEAHTRASQRLMTPEYASPEQVLGEPVSTATDVYSMGVLLYELLAGVRPFRLKSGSPLEIARSICEQVPRPPSASCATADAKKLVGDLDRIVMMAIRKEPDRRYASIAQFSSDIRAYLTGYPLLARTDSWRYRSSTFVRRHKAAVAVGVLFAVSLTGFGIGMGILARRADRLRQTAERESKFLADMFRASAPEVARGETITARMLLDRGAQRIDRELAHDPEVRAPLLETMGEAYRELGLFTDAETMAHKSLDVAMRAVGPNSPDTVRALELTAELDRDRGRYSEAEPLLKKVIDSKRRLLGPNDAEVAFAMGELGECYFWEAKDDEAIAILRQAIAIDEKNGPNAGAADRNYLALTLERKGDYEQARTLLEQATAISLRAEGPQSPDYAIMLHNLGSCLLWRGDIQGGEKLLRQALEIRRSVLGTSHQDYATSLNNLGFAAIEEADWPSAEKILKESLQIHLARLGPDNPRMAAPYSNWARVLQAEGDFSGASDYFHRALAALKAGNALNTWPAAQVTANIGMLYFDRGDYATAEGFARQAMELRRKLGGESTPAFSDSLGEVAEDLLFQNHGLEAIPMLRATVDIRRAKLWAGHPDIIKAETRLGEALVIEGKAAEAEPILSRAVAAIAAEPFPLPAWQAAETNNAYGECLIALGRAREGEPLVRGSLAGLARDPRPAFRTGVIARLKKEERSTGATPRDRSAFPR